jgi:hypothetical protein
MPLSTLPDSGGLAPESPRAPRAASLLDIRRRLDALRRCRARQARVARSNALLFAYLLRHGAPDPHQAIVLRWFLRHARLTAARHLPLPARVAVCARTSPVCWPHGTSRRAPLSGGWITGRWWHLNASFGATLTWTAPFDGSLLASSVSHVMVKKGVPLLWKIGFKFRRKQFLFAPLILFFQ